MSTVLLFSGKIASGKSTLSAAVSRELAWPRVSFGDYVRKLARTRGLDPTDDSMLQELGADMVQNHLDEFCIGVLNEVNWRHEGSLVIDGLRHVEVAARLRSIVAPSELVLVHIEVDKATRVHRLAERIVARPNAGAASLDVLDAHSTEVQVSSILPKMADLVVDGKAEETALVMQVVEWLRTASDSPLQELFGIGCYDPADTSLPPDASARHDVYLKRKIEDQL